MRKTGPYIQFRGFWEKPLEIGTFPTVCKTPQVEVEGCGKPADHRAKMERMLTQEQRKRAFDAVDYARAVREHNRRKSRKGETLRDRALRDAMARVKRAMRPVRSEIHRTQFDPPSHYRAMLLGLSANLQSERRKLWKMLQPPKNPDKIARRLADYLNNPF